MHSCTCVLVHLNYYFYLIYHTLFTRLGLELGLGIGLGLGLGLRIALGLGLTLGMGLCLGGGLRGEPTESIDGNYHRNKTIIFRSNCIKSLHRK